MENGIPSPAYATLVLKQNSMVTGRQDCLSHMELVSGPLVYVVTVMVLLTTTARRMGRMLVI